MAMSSMCDEVISSEKSGRRYSTVKVLGSGAFGEVLLAEDSLTQQQYAVKQLYLRDQEEGLPVAVAREMAALQQLHHPNIVSLLDVATHEPCFYLIQELCKTDLAALLSATNHHLPCSMVRSIMLQLLQAIAEVHARGLMHRDVKPSNVLISSCGVIKLGDFGLARCCCNNTVPTGAGSQHDHGQQQQLCVHQQLIQQLEYQSGHACLERCIHSQLQLSKQHHGSDPPMQQQHQQNTPQLAQGVGQDQQLQCVLQGEQPQQHSRYQAAQEQQPPPGHLTAAQGTRWYRAPELLYGSRQYTPAVDIWAAGMVFAEILGLSPFIPGQSDIDQLARMQQTLGSISVECWPEAEQLPDWHKICFGKNAGQPLAELLPDAPADALDLLAQMIQYNPRQRCTAAAALQHAFFANAIVATQQEVAAMVDELLAVQQPSLGVLCKSMYKVTVTP